MLPAATNCKQARFPITFVLLIVLPLLLLRAQSQNGPARKFEVASIRPSPGPRVMALSGQTPQIGLQVSGDNVRITSWSIRQYVLKAYGLETYQLSGPDWISTARFNLVAKLPAGTGRSQLEEMLRSLLVERFSLVAHTESRNLAGFALTVRKGGPKIKLAPPDPDDSAEVSNTLDELMGDGRAFGLKPITRSVNGDVHFEFTKLPIPALAQIVGSYLRKPVFDMTGLKGRYAVSLEFSPETIYTPAHVPANSADQPLDSSGASVSSAIDALGLRLGRARSRVSVLIIDHVDRAPAEN